MATSSDEASTSPELPDGSYDVLVVDIEIGEPGIDDNDHSGTPPDGDSLSIEVVITQGEHKGIVATVEFSASIDEADALQALGLPGVLTVDKGVPSLELDEPEAP